MGPVSHRGERRTSVDDIFEFLHEEISTLQLRPGDKLSEAEVAARFGVSRQPVRDAFNRLAHLDLLLIRPQRATEVKRFSMRAIEKSRFLRKSVEMEVLRRAAKLCDGAGIKRLEVALELQQELISAEDFDRFGALDYDFHHALCEIADVDFAFEFILAEKSKVDRLCRLSLSKESRLPELVADHFAIAHAVMANDPERAVEAGALHLSRLDETLAQIQETSANYFIDKGN